MSRSSPAPRPPLVTPPFLLLVGAGLSYFLALGVVIPVLPLFVDGPLGGGSVAIGVVVGAWSVSAAALRPLVGFLGDRYGRRALVLGGAVVVTLSVAAYPLASTVPLLVALRLVTGAGEAAFFVGTATAVQDLAPPSRRGEATSYFSGAIYASLAVGPMLGEAILERAGFAPVFLAAAACSALGGLFGLATPRTEAASAGAPSDGVRWRILHSAAVVPGSVLALGLMGTAGFFAFIPLYVETLGLDGSRRVFGLYALVVLTSRLLGARIPDAVGSVRASMAALVVMAAGLGTISLWPEPAGLYAGTAVFGAGMSLLFPALMIRVVEVAPERERSSAVASFSLFFDLSQGLGAPLLGTVVALADEGAAFGAGALLAVAALALLLATRGRGQPPPAATTSA